MPCIPTPETEMESPSFSEYMQIGKSSGIICMRGHFSRCWRSIGQVQTWNNVRRVGCVSPHHAASGGWEELTQPSICLYFHVCIVSYGVFFCFILSSQVHPRHVNLPTCECLPQPTDLSECTNFHSQKPCVVVGSRCSISNPTWTVDQTCSHSVLVILRHRCSL